MIVIVEIASRAGTRAWKEYDVPSLNAAVAAAQRELRAYPTLRVLDIRIKDDWSLQRDDEEDW
jgi:hypothetical protein